MSLVLLSLKSTPNPLIAPLYPVLSEIGVYKLFAEVVAPNVIYPFELIEQFV